MVQSLLTNWEPVSSTERTKSFQHLKPGGLGERRPPMNNLDIGFKLEQISRRLTVLEESIKKLNMRTLIADSDWDNATLMQEWSISKRTAANYRKQGLGYIKRGGRIYYTPEHRLKFIAKCR
jgi:hypothetical protein